MKHMFVKKYIYIISHTLKDTNFVWFLAVCTSILYNICNIMYLRNKGKRDKIRRGDILGIRHYKPAKLGEKNHENRY